MTMDVRAEIDLLLDQGHDAIAIEPSEAPDGAGWWDAYVQPGYCWSVLPTGVVLAMIDESIEVLDRHTGRALSKADIAQLAAMTLDSSADGRPGGADDE